MRQALLTLALASGLAMAQERPQLTDAEAARHRVADYLGDWQPAPLGDAKAWKADLVVALDGSGTHRTLQAALDALPARGTSPRRVYIQLKDGVYREQICVKAKVPFTLYGNAADPAAVRIVQGHYANEPKQIGEPANPCTPDLQSASYGTPGSASVAIFSDAVQLAHLTIANDAMEAVHDGQGYPPGVGESGGAQAVALMTEGDQLQMENVRLVSHQDTLFVRAPKDAPARVLISHSLIAGDVDFIFGNAQLVVDASTIVSRAGRRLPGSGGHVLAPSTAPGQRLGILINASRLVGEAGLRPGSISLGRAWDAGVAKGAWKAGESPNGQALIRDSLLGPHLGGWGASTSRRPFAATGEAANRFGEYRNKPLPALDHETLAAGDGWGSLDSGVTGGSQARPERIVEVRNRAELVGALRGFGNHPKIIRLRGRIDLNVDEQNRPMSAEAYRDPEFDLQAYLKAYDPATWGRKPLEGPLEAARLRSAKNQAARIIVQVPSNTTLIGVGSDAALVNGGLYLGKVENVIIRNIHFSDAYDYFAAWDPKDGEFGEWNSEYDSITLRGARRVWVDHCTFDDGERPDEGEPVLLGRRVQHHDGLLDITQQSDLVTVSWNRFLRHDKTNLVGSSDNQKLDEGKLRVTFHHNLWEQVKARTPRVRWGQVHLYNNLYVGSGEGGYAFEYSIGVGAKSRVFSERNVWELPQSIANPQRLTKLWKGDAFFDRGSLLNGQPVDLLAALRSANPTATISGDVGWTPILHLALDPAEQVAAKVRAGAGAGKLQPE